MMLFKHHPPPTVSDILLVKDVTVGESGREKEQPQLTGSGSDVDQALMGSSTGREEQRVWLNPSSLLLAASCARRVWPSDNLVGSAEFANTLKWLIDCVLITFTLII